MKKEVPRRKKQKMVSPAAASYVPPTFTVIPTKKQKLSPIASVLQLLREDKRLRIEWLLNSSQSALVRAVTEPKALISTYAPLVFHVSKHIWRAMVERGNARRAYYSYVSYCQTIGGICPTTNKPLTPHTFEYWYWALDGCYEKLYRLRPTAEDSTDKPKRKREKDYELLRDQLVSGGWCPTGYADHRITFDQIARSAYCPSLSDNYRTPINVVDMAPFAYRNTLNVEALKPTGEKVFPDIGKKLPFNTLWCDKCVDYVPQVHDCKLTCDVVLDVYNATVTELWEGRWSALGDGLRCEQDRLQRVACFNQLTTLDCIKHMAAWVESFTPELCVIEWIDDGGFRHCSQLEHQVSSSFADRICTLPITVNELRALNDEKIGILLRKHHPMSDNEAPTPFCTHHVWNAEHCQVCKLGIRESLPRREEFTSISPRVCKHVNLRSFTFKDGCTIEMCPDCSHHYTTMVSNLTTRDRERKKTLRERKIEEATPGFIALWGDKLTAHRLYVGAGLSSDLLVEIPGKPRVIEHAYRLTNCVTECALKVEALPTNSGGRANTAGTTGTDRDGIGIDRSKRDLDAEEIYDYRQKELKPLTKSIDLYSFEEIWDREGTKFNPNTSHRQRFAEEWPDNLEVIVDIAQFELMETLLKLKQLEEATK